VPLVVRAWVCFWRDAVTYMFTSVIVPSVKWGYTQVLVPSLEVARDAARWVEATIIIPAWHAARRLVVKGAGFVVEVVRWQIGLARWAVTEAWRVAGEVVAWVRSNGLSTVTWAWVTFARPAVEAVGGAAHWAKETGLALAAWALEVAVWPMYEAAAGTASWASQLARAVVQWQLDLAWSLLDVAYSILDTVKELAATVIGIVTSVQGGASASEDQPASQQSGEDSVQ
jgi:hypothetical protein